MQNFYENIPKTPTLRLHKSFIKMQFSSFFRLIWSLCDIDYTGKRNSQIRVHMRELWQFKVCEKLLSCCQNRIFLSLGNVQKMCLTSFWSLITWVIRIQISWFLSLNCREKWDKGIGKKIHSFGNRMQPVQRVEVGLKPIFDILSIIWILGNFYRNGIFLHISVYIYL